MLELRGLSVESSESLLGLDIALRMTGRTPRAAILYHVPPLAPYSKQRMGGRLPGVCRPLTGVSPVPFLSTKNTQETAADGPFGGRDFRLVADGFPMNVICPGMPTRQTVRVADLLGNRPHGAARTRALQRPKHPQL